MLEFNNYVLLTAKEFYDLEKFDKKKSYAVFGGDIGTYPMELPPRVKRSEAKKIIKNKLPEDIVEDSGKPVITFYQKGKSVQVYYIPESKHVSKASYLPGGLLLSSHANSLTGSDSNKGYIYFVNLDDGNNSIAISAVVDGIEVISRTITPYSVDEFGVEIAETINQVKRENRHCKFEVICLGFSEGDRSSFDIITDLDVHFLSSLNVPRISPVYYFNLVRDYPVKTAAAGVIGGVAVCLFAVFMVDAAKISYAFFTKATTQSEINSKKEKIESVKERLNVYENNAMPGTKWRQFRMSFSRVQRMTERHPITFTDIQYQDECLKVTGHFWSRDKKDINRGIKECGNSLHGLTIMDTGQTHKSGGWFYKVVIFGGDIYHENGNNQAKCRKIGGASKDTAFGSSHDHSGAIVLRGAQIFPEYPGKRSLLDKAARAKESAGREKPETIAQEIIQAVSDYGEVMAYEGPKNLAGEKVENYRRQKPKKEAGNNFAENNMAKQAGDRSQKHSRREDGTSGPNKPEHFPSQSIDQRNRTAHQAKNSGSNAVKRQDTKGRRGTEEMSHTEAPSGKMSAGQGGHTPGSQAEALRRIENKKKRLASKKRELERLRGQMDNLLKDVRRTRKDMAHSKDTPLIVEDIHNKASVFAKMWDIEVSQVIREKRRLKARVNELKERKQKDVSFHNPKGYRLAAIAGDGVIMVGIPTGRRHYLSIGDTLVYDNTPFKLDRVDSGDKAVFVSQERISGRNVILNYTVENKNDGNSGENNTLKLSEEVNAKSRK